MLSHAASRTGLGWGFGLHELLDQTGAMIGPLVIALILWLGGGYRLGFAVLLLPALISHLPAAVRPPPVSASARAGATGAHRLHQGLRARLLVLQSGGGADRRRLRRLRPDRVPLRQIRRDRGALDCGLLRRRDGCGGGDGARSGMAVRSARHRGRRLVHRPCRGRRAVGVSGRVLGRARRHRPVGHRHGGAGFGAESGGRASGAAGSARHRLRHLRHRARRRLVRRQPAAGLSV